MKRFLNILAAALALFGAWACQPESTKEETVAFKLSANNASFDYTGGETTLYVSSSSAVSVASDASWVTAEQQTSTSKVNSKFIIKVAENASNDSRTASLKVTSGSDSGIFTVSQEGAPKEPDPEPETPDYTDPDKTGMGSDSKTLAGKMILGWNLGNTMEATGGETALGNARTTENLIKKVKEAGFNAVRIPCAWDSKIDDKSTYHISDSWMDRVQEVVDYVVNNDMYAILNIHWDGGWLEEHPTYAYKDKVNEEQAALWKQIAIRFRDYDEHLLFAGANEVHADYGDPSAENIEVLGSYMQTFVDAVRATGGKNYYRNLVVQVYNTNIDHGVKYFTAPTDKVSDRMMVEVHYYDPYNYTLDSNESSWKCYWGKDYKSYGIDNWGQETYLDAQFEKCKSAFVDKGYPVILGEFSAMCHSTSDENMIASRSYYHEYLVKSAKSNGMVPFYWDNGPYEVKSSGLFKRSSGEVLDQATVDALVKGSSQSYPF